MVALRLRAGRAVCAYLATVPILLGCETMGTPQIGAAIGSVAGAAIGRQIDDGGAMGTAIGAGVGAAVGYAIGRYMDERDLSRRNEALEQNPVGRTTAWRNEDTGAAYRVTPRAAAYQGPQGTCRAFEQEVYVDGKRDSVTATACKRGDSENWEVVDTQESGTSSFI